MMNFPKAENDQKHEESSGNDEDWKLRVIETMLELHLQQVWEISH
jgi:hypothetical protein